MFAHTACPPTVMHEHFLSCALPRLEPLLNFFEGFFKAMKRWCLMVNSF